MAYKEFCSECDKPLTGKPCIYISQMTIRDADKTGQVNNTHFCDASCAKSFLVKNINKPLIHGAQ